MRDDAVDDAVATLDVGEAGHGAGAPSHFARAVAAILPLPLKRHPDHMHYYSALILERMRQVGW